MSYGIICRAKDCREYATHRFTFPGQAETYRCEKHTMRSVSIAIVLRLPLKLIDLTNADHRGPEGMKGLEEQGK